jgi:hypothetical protein
MPDALSNFFICLLASSSSSLFGVISKLPQNGQDLMFCVQICKEEKPFIPEAIKAICTEYLTRGS